MEKEYLHLAQNIRTLRKSYKLSQEELAFLLDLSAQSAVSQYESGKRVPEPEIIKKLLDLFQITEDELKYHKIIPIEFTPTQSRTEIYKKIADLLFPIISPDDAENDEDLKEAYKLHIKIKKQGENDDIIFSTQFEHCLRLYISSVATNSSPIAAANLLWLILREETKSINAEKMKKCKTKRYYSSKTLISPLDFLQVFIQGGIYDETEEDYSDLIYGLIAIMKEDKKMSKLGDYYIALRYIVGNVRNGRSQAENRMVGEEMMQSLKKCGNSYASNFFKILSKNMIFL